jgi:hypothetical protein
LTQHNKSSLWLWHADDTLVVWPHGPEQLQNFLSHPNSLRPSIQFTMEIRVRQCDSFSGCSGHQKMDNWPKKFTENPPTLANSSTSKPTIHRM